MKPLTLQHERVRRVGWRSLNGTVLQASRSVLERTHGQDGDVLVWVQSEVAHTQPRGDVGGATHRADANVLAPEVIDGLNVRGDDEDVRQHRAEIARHHQVTAARLGTDDLGCANLGDLYLSRQQGRHARRPGDELQVDVQA